MFTAQLETSSLPPLCEADMRQAVSFTFYPEGYDWVEPTPTLLSEGHSGVLPSPLVHAQHAPRAAICAHAACFAGKVAGLSTRWCCCQETRYSPAAGRGHGRQQLPDRFRLARPSASVPVEVFVHRTIELGSWLLDAKVRGGMREMGKDACTIIESRQRHACAACTAACSASKHGARLHTATAAGCEEKDC